MKKVFQCFISTILTLGLLFGPGFFYNPAIITDPQIWVVVLASVIMFSTQPEISKSDIFNSSDQYSMLGIMLMGIVVTNITVIEFGVLKKVNNSMSFINIIGLLMISGGLIFRIHAINVLGKYFSNAAEIKDKHQLFEGNIYSVIRHPSYTGAISSIIGTILWLNSRQTLPISMCLVFLAYFHRITQEEKILSLHFGEKYREYCKRTGALLPKLRSRVFLSMKLPEKK